MLYLKLNTRPLGVMVLGGSDVGCECLTPWEVSVPHSHVAQGSAVLVKENSARWSAEFPTSSETAPKQLNLGSLNVAQFSGFLRKLNQIVVGKRTS